MGGKFGREVLVEPGPAAIAGQQEDRIVFLAIPWKTILRGSVIVSIVACVISRSKIIKRCVAAPFLRGAASVSDEPQISEKCRLAPEIDSLLARQEKIETIGMAGAVVT